jgi:hypothetical protein
MTEDFAKRLRTSGLRLYPCSALARREWGMRLPAVGMLDLCSCLAAIKIYLFHSMIIIFMSNNHIPSEGVSFMRKVLDTPEVATL